MYFNEGLYSLLALPYYRDEETRKLLVISVRKLVKTAGIGSSVVMQLRTCFNNSRWFQSWLRLKIGSLGWFTVDGVFWGR